MGPDEITLFIGGSLNHTSTTERFGVARLDFENNTWIPMNGGVFPQDVYALDVHPETNTLYAGGSSVVDHSAGGGVDTPLPSSALTSYNASSNTWTLVDMTFQNPHTNTIMPVGFFVTDISAMEFAPSGYLFVGSRRDLSGNTHAAIPLNVGKIDLQQSSPTPGLLTAFGRPDLSSIDNHIDRIGDTIAGWRTYQDDVVNDFALDGTRAYAAGFFNTAVHQDSYITDDEAVFNFASWSSPGGADFAVQATEDAFSSANNEIASIATDIHGSRFAGVHESLGGLIWSLRNSSTWSPISLRHSIFDMVGEDVIFNPNGDVNVVEIDEYGNLYVAGDMETVIRVNRAHVQYDIAESGGDLWVTGPDLLHYDGTSWTTKAFPGFAKRIDMDENEALWVVDADGDLLKHDGEFTATSLWQHEEDNLAVDVGVHTPTSIWIISNEQHAGQDGNYTIKHKGSGSWTTVTGGAIAIDVENPDAGLPWIVQRGGGLFRFKTNPNGWVRMPDTFGGYIDVANSPDPASSDMYALGKLGVIYKFSFSQSAPTNLANLTIGMDYIEIPTTQGGGYWIKEKYPSTQTRATGVSINTKTGRGLAILNESGSTNAWFVDQLGRIYKLNATTGNAEVQEIP